MSTVDIESLLINDFSALKAFSTVHETAFRRSKIQRLYPPNGALTGLVHFASLLLQETTTAILFK